MSEQVAPPPAASSEDAPRPAEEPATPGATEEPADPAVADASAADQATAGEEPAEQATVGKEPAEQATAGKETAEEATAGEKPAGEKTAEPPEAKDDAPEAKDDAPEAKDDTPEAEAAAPQGEAKRSATGKVLGVLSVLGVLGAVFAIGVVAALKFNLGAAVATVFDQDGTAKAKAGDCLAELPDVSDGETKDVRRAEVVDCTSPKAVYAVVGRVDGQTEAEASTGKACEPFLQPEQDGFFFYNIRPGSTGYLLCLTKKA